jgi:membrane protease YdiL (CAAX protease family)
VKTFIRNLPVPAEFCLVLFVGFGLGNIYIVWTMARQGVMTISDGIALGLLVLKLLELGVILWIGRIRGWSVSTFGWQISWKGTAIGILLFIAAAMVKILALISLARIHSPGPGLVIAGLTVPVIILLALINPFFEELLEGGYFIHSLQRYGIWIAVLASSVFRGALHLYQGFNGAAAIFAGGILFGLAYWRWQQLWPLVVAHFLDDSIGLLYFRHAA